jgi:ParB family transcriptional regulator, chromosome partitioning protein
MGQIMTTKNKRTIMLNGLAGAGQSTPAPSTSMMSTNRVLPSARDAVDSRQVWDLDPDAIEDGWIADRLDPNDVADLRDAIETNGQTVPIFVRRHPSVPDRYLLVCGRHRLQAIRSSDKVQTVRALFGQELVETGFCYQTQVAEVLTVTKSSISMAIAIAEQIGRDLIRATGAAHGIRRPRSETLGKAIESRQIHRDRLIEIADTVRSHAEVAMVVDEFQTEPNDLSVKAFEAVMAAAEITGKPTKTPPARPRTLSVDLTVGGKTTGKIVRSPKGVSLDLEKVRLPIR